MSIIYNTDELERYLNRMADKAASEAAAEATQTIKKKIRKVADNAIDKWYAGYSPLYYTGRGKLKNYEITEDSQSFYVDFNQNYADHQDNDLVSEIVIAVGYHGGSPGDGTDTISWRSPVPSAKSAKGNWKYDPNGTNGYYHWGRPATHSPAIINEINDKVVQLSGEHEKLTMQLFSKKFASG